MKRLAICAGIAAAFLTFAASAQAAVITSGGFPSAGDLYHSATNGNGAIPAGGQTAYMWTTGDFVSTANASVNGSYLATSLTDTFTIANVLGAGNNLTVDAFLNGIDVGSWTVNGLSNPQITFNASFAPIFLSGNFTFEYVLQNTIPGGGGSIAFLDGGQGTIFGTAVNVPEPFTLSLFGAGIAGVAAARRRKQKSV